MHDIGKIVDRRRRCSTSPARSTLRGVGARCACTRCTGPSWPRTMPGLDQVARRRHPRAPHALRPATATRERRPRDAAAPREPHRRGRRRVRRDDVAAQLLRGAAARTRRSRSWRRTPGPRSTRCSCGCSSQMMGCLPAALGRAADHAARSASWSRPSDGGRARARRARVRRRRRAPSSSRATSTSPTRRGGGRRIERCLDAAGLNVDVDDFLQ